jgi:hypothetical protein
VNNEGKARSKASLAHPTTNGYDPERERAVYLELFEREQLRAREAEHRGIALIDLDAPAPHQVWSPKDDLEARLATPRSEVPADEESSSWKPIDLAPILAGEQIAEPPSLLAREDGICLLYRARVHSLYGEPEAGKGWVALKAAADELAAGEYVLYIDFEDDAETAVERLLALGVDPEVILDRFVYLRPDESLASEESRAELDAALRPAPSLVVIDGMTEALEVEDLDLNNNKEVAHWIRTVPRRIARETGAAILIIDHVVKDRDSRGGSAIGAQHKKAGIHTAYLIEAVKPFGRGLDGSSRIKVEKDRPGHVRRHAKEKVIAEMEFSSALDSGTVTINLGTPDSKKWVPTEKMEEISVFLEAQSEPMSRNKIVKGPGVGSKEETVDKAIHALAAGGYIKVDQQGSGKPTLHSHIKPYRAPSKESGK